MAEKNAKSDDALDAKIKKLQQQKKRLAEQRKEELFLNAFGYNWMEAYEKFKAGEEMKVGFGGTRFHPVLEKKKTKGAPKACTGEPGAPDISAGV